MIPSNETVRQTPSGLPYLLMLLLPDKIRAVPSTFEVKQLKTKVSFKNK